MRDSILSVYEKIEKDNSMWGYVGLKISKDKCIEHLNGRIKDILIDREEQEELRKDVENIIKETGFKPNKQLIDDIEYLESKKVDVEDFRIGEAYAEVILKENFSCRFYWNELRDTRNPRGHKTGADLVGFIEIDSQVFFLFGEVKTSSDRQAPPKVMENMEKQLKDLYKDSTKRLHLIGYLRSKKVLSTGFNEDFNRGIKTYYSKESSSNYQLVGVLVRDTEPTEKDLSSSYRKLKLGISTTAGLRLIAIYLPIRKENWMDIINKGAA